MRQKKYMKSHSGRKKSFLHIPRSLIINGKKMFRDLKTSKLAELILVLGDCERKGNTWLIYQGNKSIVGSRVTSFLVSL